jgi:threonine/homoserine/homoserine lactone efflux protein
MLSFLIKGLSIGFLIAAPVGPIGVLCIRRTLAEGWRAGLLTGLGAATADALYGCVAAFGLTAISDLLTGQRFWLGLLGGIFLCYLGVRTSLTPPAQEAAQHKKSNLAGAYLTTVLLTLTNPATILSFVAVFAGLGLSASPDYLTASSLVFGVFAGSALWWLILSSSVATLQTRIKAQALKTVNVISGLVLVCFGLFAIITTIR